MITMQEFMEVVKYRITEGSQYGWACFGHASYCLSSWNGDHDGWSFNIIFDTEDQTVYVVEAHDYKRDRAYRLINEDYKDRYFKYAKNEHPEYVNNAWEDVDYVDLESDDDWFQKALAIVSGEDYDTRVSIPLEFSDEELLTYMKMAHERDITFNQLVEEAIRSAIEESKADPEGFKRRAEKHKSRA